MEPSYKDFSQKTRSRKLVLSTIEAMQKRTLFTGSPVYQCESGHFVSGVVVDGVELVKDENLPQSSFYYDAQSGVLSFRLENDESTQGKNIFLRLRFFFSNIPQTLKTELSDNVEVEFDSRLKTYPSLRLELDYENTGTVIETSSSVSLENGDGYFDDFYDSLIWEGQKAFFYSFNEEISTDAKYLFYRGKIETKSFSTSEIQFRLKDQVADLREQVAHVNFSESDGRVPPSFIDKPKRQVFGRVDSMTVAPLDAVIDGYPVAGNYSGSADRNLMTGSVSGVLSSTTITGTGTLFFSEILPDDEILITDGIFQYVYKVLSIASDTSLQTTQPISAGFSLAQPRNKSIRNNVILGTGCEFKKFLSPNDSLVVNIDGVIFNYKIDEVLNDNEVILSDDIEITFSAMSHKPEIPSRWYNRQWSVSGHKLRSTSHEITLIIDAITFEVDNIDELVAGDILIINGEYRRLTQITGQTIRVNQSIFGVQNFDVFEKVPVPNIYNGVSRFVFGRDYQVLNLSVGCNVIIDNLAEFNIQSEKSLSTTFSFVNGSDIITALSTDRDMTTIFRPRDWIISQDLTHQVWYEILSVDDLSIRVRLPYAGSNYSGSLRYKRPEYIGDNSLVLCDAIGKEFSGKWIKRPSDVVKNILEEAQILDLNLPSFEQASFDCDYESSYFLPPQLGQSMPSIRDAITQINNSVFGSLYFDNDFNFTYKILNADKPDDLEEITDEDTLGYSMTTSNQIIGRAVVRFRPQTDRLTGQESFLNAIEESSFVKSTSAIRKEQEFTSYIYREQDAQIIAERWAFFRSMSQNIVRIESKLQLIGYALNQPIFVSLSRIFKRYGGKNRKKIGLVSGFEKTGDRVMITFNDLANIFNRVPAIAPDETEDYLDESESIIAKFGFIVDNITETPDESSESELGNNLIG
jgi:hypothetical protein